jgi:hypothetical protein
LGVKLQGFSEGTNRFIVFPLLFQQVESRRKGSIFAAARYVPSRISVARFTSNAGVQEWKRTITVPRSRYFQLNIAGMTVQTSGGHRQMERGMMLF